MAELDQRSSIIGAVIGLVVGGVSGFLGASLNVDSPPAAAAAASASTVRPSAAPPPASAIPKAGPEAAPSFAQQGEDLVLFQLTVQTGLKRKVTYLDIGAHEPLLSNNTYIFYATGSRGVLVEPNPVYAEKNRKQRPGDVVLEVGVGLTKEDEADYYVIAGDGQLNTFSKKQADTLVAKHHQKIDKVIKRPLVPINKIMEEHFKDKAPDVMSIDIEGLDLAILESLDWKRWRPRIICVETSMAEDGRVNPAILKLMDGLGYTVRGGSFVNTIFLDEKTWRAEMAAQEVAEKADAGN